MHIAFVKANTEVRLDLMVQNGEADLTSYKSEMVFQGAYTQGEQ